MAPSALASQQSKRATLLVTLLNNTSKMQVMRASLLLHRGYGARHGDLILETGARCLTLRISCQQGRWRVAIAEPHRRRYLTYRGPLSGGCGIVDVLWSGTLDGWCSVAGPHWRLYPNAFFMSQLRRLSRTHRQPAKALFWAPFGSLGNRRQGVVRQPRPQTLPRL